MKILILEDSEERIKAFKQNFIGTELFFTDKPAIAIEELKKGGYDSLFLDHDLGGTAFSASDENSGYAVAKWLNENPQYQPALIVLHSLNPIGVQNMKAELPNAKIVPFIWNLKLND
jgi:CheY-like chemotaxis protein